MSSTLSNYRDGGKHSSTPPYLDGPQQWWLSMRQEDDNRWLGLLPPLHLCHGPMVVGSIEIPFSIGCLADIPKVSSIELLQIPLPSSPRFFLSTTPKTLFSSSLHVPIRSIFTNVIEDIDDISPPRLVVDLNLETMNLLVDLDGRGARYWCVLACILQEKSGRERERGNKCRDIFFLICEFYII